MQLNWTDNALAKLDEIETFIAKENPVAAIEQVLRIIYVVEQLLTQHPFMGRKGREKGTRELVIDKTSFVVVYRALGDSIDILHVDHQAQRK